MQGKEVLLMLDINAHIYRSPFAHKLTELGFEELFRKTNSAEAPHSHVSGSTPVCAVYATQGFDCREYFVFGHDVGVGDHRLHALSFTNESIFGTSAPTPPKRQGRNLQCSQIKTTKAYQKSLETMQDRHKLDHKLDIISLKLDELESDAPGSLSAVQIKCLADKLDKEHTEFQVYSDKTCRKKKDGKLPWTPDSGIWWIRRRVYRRLVRYHKGYKTSMKSLCQACKRNKIPPPHETTLQFAYEGIKRCTDKLKEFRPLAHSKRREHMTNRLHFARREDNAAKVTEIERIMMREEGRKTWGRLGCATKKKRSPPASQCAVTDENGERTVFTGQGPFETATKGAVYRRYHGANDAPINSGQLRQDFGTIADTASAEAILTGAYEFPKDRC